jgi:hypothetical protein
MLQIVIKLPYCIIHTFSPTGKTIRSKVQLIRYLGSSSIDLTDFDYQAGKILNREARHARSAGRPARDTASPGGTMKPRSAGGGSRSGHHSASARGLCKTLPPFMA